MKRILLDSSTLIKYPQLLSISAPDTQLTITVPVLNEISNYPLSGSGASLRPTAEKALDAGILELSLLSAWDLKGAVSTDESKLGVWNEPDRHLLASAAAYKKLDPTIDVYVATDDKGMIELSPRFGVQTITTAQLRELLQHSGKQNELIEAEVKLRAKRHRWIAFVNLVGGVVIGLLANYIYSYLQIIVQTIRVWGTLLGILVLAFILFALRSHFRLFYRLSEFAVGGVLCLRLFWPNFDYSMMSSVLFLQLIGGLYVMVRGLDNISHGLRGTSLYPYIDRWFPD